MDGACTRFLCVPTGSGVAHLRRIEACIEVAPSGRRPSNVLRVGARRLAARIGRLVTVGRTVGVAGALEVATPGLVVATAESREQRAPLRLNRATSSARHVYQRYFWHGWFRPIIRCSPNLSGN